MTYELARANMIESQIRPNKVTDERVIAAFARIRREIMVPDALRGVAYVDQDLPLGNGRYLMQAMVAARLIQAAAVTRSDAALVVGAGVGYEAAILSLLARSVVALEEDEELSRRGHAAIVEQRITTVNYVEGPLVAGYRTRGPYDVILFAGAVAEIPPEISTQLAEGGRMVAVIRAGNGVGRGTLTIRTGAIQGARAMFDAAIPLLPGFLPKPAFAF